MYTMQEAFEKMCKHIFEQGERSVTTVAGEIACLYRGPRGLKCVVGALIPDEEYRPEFEGSDGVGLSVVNLLCDFRVPSLDGLVLNFLLQMQCIHDVKSNWASSGVMRTLLVKKGLELGLDVSFLASLAFRDR